MYILIGNDWIKKSELAGAYFNALRALACWKRIPPEKKEAEDILIKILESIDDFSKLSKENLWTNVDTVGFKWYCNALEIVDRIQGISWNDFSQKFPVRAEIYIKLGLVRESIPSGATLAKKQDLERIFLCR